MSEFEAAERVHEQRHGSARSCEDLVFRTLQKLQRDITALSVCCDAREAGQEVSREAARNFACGVCGQTRVSLAESASWPPLIALLDVSPLLALLLRLPSSGGS